MCMIKKLLRFLRNGSKTLRDASRGEYTQESEAVLSIKKELFRETSRMDDKKNLMKDNKAVKNDARNAWHKITLSNG